MNPPIIENMRKKILPGKWKSLDFLLLHALTWEPWRHGAGLVEEHPAIVSHQNSGCLDYSAKATQRKLDIPDVSTYFGLAYLRKTTPSVQIGGCVTPGKRC